MVSKVFVIVAALCFAQAFAKPSGDDNIQKLSQQVQALFQTFTAEIAKTMEFKETKESKQITENLKTNANEFAGKLSEILTTVNKEAFSTPSGDDNIKKLAEQVQALFQTFTSEITKALDIKETKESKQITESLKSNANEFAGKLSEILTTVCKEAKAHEGTVNTTIESLKTKVEETVKKIQDEYPAAKVKEYQESIQKIYSELFTKAKEAADTIAKDSSGIQQDLQKFTEDVITQVKTQLEKVNADIKKSIDEHQKKHKH